jgi:hypothetical protein
MTGPTTPPPEQWPDGSDLVDQALTQLQEPRHLLAEALILTRAAQDEGPDVDTYGPDSPAAGRHRRLLDEAFQLMQVAKVATELAADDAVRLQLTDDSLDEPDMESRTSPPNDLSRTYKPQAVNGVRFTAEVRGRYLGHIGDDDWIWGEQFGYLDVSHAEHVGDTADHHGEVGAVFNGTVKSTCGGMILGVTDQGGAVILPRYAVTEWPDE